MPEQKERLIFNHTIDGVPVNESVAPPRPAENSRAFKEGKAAHTVSNRKKSPKKLARHDPYIWGIYISLLIISVVELFSASSSEIRGGNVYAPLISHCLHLAIGLGIVLWIQNVHYGYFSRFAWVCAIGSLILLIYGSFFGASINGAQRAINLPGFSLQPAEMVKLTVVVLLATILGRTQRPGGVSTGGVIYVAVVVIIFSAILWVNGLTNTILLMGVSVSMFLIGGIQMRKLLIVALIYGCSGGMLYMIKESREKTNQFEMVSNGDNIAEAAAAGKGSIGRMETHENRLKEFMRGVKPTDTVTDKNRQVFYATMAQANGGLIGHGPGNSRENARLPLAFSDYIFSIVVEDIGFLGGVGLLMLYLFLLARAGRIAYKCRRAFPAFLIMGCAVLIVFQALVHMAIVTGVAPVSGQPLPLISKGGTSVLVMSTAIGIMLSVSRYAVTTTDRKENREEAKILPDDMLAQNVSVIE
ncbi:MAG: FtsW/RodA/SpoVE family cell cycle protein [Muribaculaceae bacterium]|nr:FtsW/RodA/SpoVE family cell cycle protein [Muribaculaceae bacterium]